MDITYKKVGDYYLPDLTVPENKYTISKYGIARLAYLKSNKRCFYNNLMMNEKLFKYLHEIDVQAQIILEQFIKSVEKNAPDKATHQMEWVGYMNNVKASAEEIINQELIYV